MVGFYRHRYLLFYEGWSAITPTYVEAHQLGEAARDRVARLSALVPVGGRVLDVGCGAALFLDELHRGRNDVAVRGIEPGRMQARYASRVMGVSVFEGSYQDFPLSEPFDLVTAFHITEHVPDLADFLAFLRRNVRADGHVAIESPNLNGSWNDLSMFHIAHLYAFTPESIRVLAEKHGFEVTRITTSDSGWDWPNLHALLRPVAQLAGKDAKWTGERIRLSAALREKLRRVAVPRWICIVRTWAKILLRYVGLGRQLDIWRLRRRARASGGQSLSGFPPSDQG